MKETENLNHFGASEPQDIISEESDEVMLGLGTQSNSKSENFEVQTTIHIVDFQKKSDQRSKTMGEMIFESFGDYLIEDLDQVELDHKERLIYDPEYRMDQWLIQRGPDTLPIDELSEIEQDPDKPENM